MARLNVVLISALSVGVSLLGITWGLPSRSIDPYLFGNEAPWPGERIYRLAGAEGKLSKDALKSRGADVDIDPLGTGGQAASGTRAYQNAGPGINYIEEIANGRPLREPVLLTGSDEDVAKILLRYRLYTYQPDEMITMMALAGMNPRKLQFDPRLYQYGGLFIYPVGAMIGAAGAVGLIDVRSDVVYYLDHPDEFGKFYIVARLYAALWGVVGVIVVYLITKRLASTMGADRPLPHGRGSGESLVGVLAALLFTMMPVVVCMAHEGKPHLPGAVLMLCAVWFAMRRFPSQAPSFEELGSPNFPEHRLKTGATRKLDSEKPSVESRGLEPAAEGHWWGMCVCCGAAVGIVLSSWPIFVLIPLMAFMEWRGAGHSFGRAVRRCLGGAGIGVAVYAMTNPYVFINAIINRDVLISNFGNSLAMYEIARIGEGFVRVLHLTVQGATWPVATLGGLGFLAALWRWKRMSPIYWILIVPALMIFFQFVAIGAGKPAEYGRFGIFPNTALAIGTACVLSGFRRRIPALAFWPMVTIAALWTGWGGWSYLANFRTDARGAGSRIALAAKLSEVMPGFQGGGRKPIVYTTSEPAPYNLPPIRFDRADIRLVPEWLMSASAAERSAVADVLLQTVDDSRPMVSGVAPATTAKYDWWRFPVWRIEPSGSRFWQTILLDDSPISWANKPFRVSFGRTWAATLDSEAIEAR